MLNDVYLEFKNIYQQTDGKILTKNILLEKEPSICIKIDEKANIIDKLIVLDENVKKDNLYDWFSIRNIKSKYLSSNKSVGTPMIFSSNNYSLFGRTDTFPFITKSSFEKLFNVKEDKNNKKSTRKSIFFNKYKNTQIKKIFEDKEHYFLDEFFDKFSLLEVDEKKLLEEDSYITDFALSKYYDKLLNEYECSEEQFFTFEVVNKILYQLKNDFIKYSHKQIKLKIFRDKSIDDYEKLELNYLSASLFAVEDESKVLDGKYGQPYLDSTLNVNKPFLLHHTTKYKVPFPKIKEEIKYLKYLDDFLSMNKGLFYLNCENFSTSNKPFLNGTSKKGQYIILKKTNYRIFEFLPNYTNEFFKKPFIIKNFMQIKKNKKIKDDEKAFSNTWQLEKVLNKYFGNKLVTNYFSEKIEKINKSLETYIFLIRYSCFLYFKKSQISGEVFYQNIKDVLYDLMTYYWINEDEKFINNKILELMNLRLSMKEYYKGECMNIMRELKFLKDRISQKDYDELSSKEFLLLSGQMAYYLTYQNETKNKTFRLVEHYLKSKNSKMIKIHLKNDFQKYKHKLYLIGENSKFKKSMSLLLSYDKEDKFSSEDFDVFLIGLISDNILF